MNRLFVALFSMMATFDGSAAVIGFTGPYAPPTWTTVVTGDASGSSVSFTSTTLSLTGGQSASGCTGGVFAVLGPCEVRVITTQENPFSFHWTYSTADPSGPAADVFGVRVDGVRIVLSDSAGALNQSGDFVGSAVSSFGWFINCTDCTRGAANAIITNFTAGVAPAGVDEPGTIALLVAAFAMAAAAFRRRPMRQ